MKARWPFVYALVATLLLYVSVAHSVTLAQAEQSPPTEDSPLAPNDVLVFGNIDHNLAMALALKIKMLDATLPDDIPIVVMVDSPGGDIDAGNMIIDAMIGSSHKVVTVDTAAAESMGAFVFLAGEERFMWQDSFLMLHDANISLSGTPSQVESQLRHEESIIAVIENRTAKMAKISLEEYHKRCLSQWFLSADEAVKAGLATKVLTKE